MSKVQVSASIFVNRNLVIKNVKHCLFDPIHMKKSIKHNIYCGYHAYHYDGMVRKKTSQMGKRNYIVLANIEQEPTWIEWMFQELTVVWFMVSRTFRHRLHL